MEQLELNTKIQQLQESDQQKDQFLSQVTHDLRTPLNVINYLLDEVNKKSQNNQQILKSIEMCRCNSNMLMSLINDILDYAQLKENQMKLNLQSFSLKKTLAEVQDMLKIQFELKQIRLNFYNLIKSEDDIIYSDQRRLKQVLINLLTNALKFTTSGEVTVISKLFHSDKQFLKFQVQDTGIGIEKDKITQIGAPYATFNQQNLNNCGIGMGLFICKKIIGKIGPSEELFIKSTLGIGSTFGFVIYRTIQQSNDNQIYNFKSFFQISPLQSKSRIFSFDKLSSGEGQKQKRSSQKVLTPDKNFKTIKKIMFRRQQSMLLENNSPVSNLQPLNKQNKMLSVQFGFQIKDPEMQQLEEFTQQQEIQYQTPNSYVTKPKKNIINLGQTQQKEYYYNSETDSVLQGSKFPEKYILMIADDDTFNQLILENYLQDNEQINVEIIKAFHGQQAKDLFMNYNSIENNNNKQQISIILMDCMMPILDGYSATKQIKELIGSGDYYDCIIIAYTGNSGTEEELKCKEAGFDAYLYKPASKNDLIQAIYNHLN